MKLSIFKISFFFVVGLYKSTQCKNALPQNRVADLEIIPSFLAAWLVNQLKIWMTSHPFKINWTNLRRLSNNFYELKLFLAARLHHYFHDCRIVLK